MVKFEDAKCGIIYNFRNSELETYHVQRIINNNPNQKHQEWLIIGTNGLKLEYGTHSSKYYHTAIEAIGQHIRHLENHLEYWKKQLEEREKHNA